MQWCGWLAGVVLVAPPTQPHVAVVVGGYSLARCDCGLGSGGCRPRPACHTRSTLVVADLSPSPLPPSLHTRGHPPPTPANPNPLHPPRLQLLHSYQSRSFRPDFTDPKKVNAYSKHGTYRTDADLTPKH